MRGATVVRTFAILGMLTVAGCSSNRAERDRVDSLTLDLPHTSAVRVLGAHVHPTNGHAVIHGRVRHQVWGASVLAGHVDIEVQTPDGQVLQHLDVPLETAVHPMNQSQDAIFRTEMPHRVPEGSTLRIHYHHGPHA